MMHAFGNRIRTLRTQHQMTQAQLAEKLGVQYQTVSKWETGATLPDTAMLPQLADRLGVSIDDLFGRRRPCGAAAIPDDKTAFLLQTYAQMYGPEAGPWNLSVANKYLEYRFTDFFERNFSVTEGTSICNIGIGAGMWDTYLSYKLKNGKLTSIDKLEVCCRQLEQRLIYEGNPNDVNVICADVMSLGMDGAFDIVTMVGSTVMESGVGFALLEKAMKLVKPGGAIYYQSLDKNEDTNIVIQTAYRHGMKLTAYLTEDAYGFHTSYYKFSESKMK